MDVLTKKVLAMFGSFNKETLDLHELFEAGGNDPDVRSAVLDRVERLVEVVMPSIENLLAPGARIA